MDHGVKRARVFQYKKSGKLIAVIHSEHNAGRFVLTLSPNMTAVTEIANRKYIKSTLLIATKYHAEFRETLINEDGKPPSVSFGIVRVLASEDMDIARWQRTPSLDDLPVSAEPELTPEERLWVGERKGNVAGGVALTIVTVVAIFFVVSSSGGSWIANLIALISGCCLACYKWQSSYAGIPEKISAIQNHKGRLRQDVLSRQQSARTQFQLLLGDYRNWDQLSPRQFELALSHRLENAGYKEVRVTQHSKDGGIDIEAVSNSGVAVIVQAKKYAGNVGVSIVREMIGIRESRPDRPHTIIYSLNGFSRGAKELAARNGVELRDIKSELLSV